MLGEKEQMIISLLPSKVSILIVGGGKVGYSKSKSFLYKGCEVYILSEEFCEKFENLKNYPNIHMIRGQYDKKYIYDKHLVIIATNCEEINSTIRKDCIESFKIYIDCTKGREGNCITPCQRSTKNISFAINTKVVSPKTSVFIADVIKKQLEEYDDFVGFTAHIRNNISDIVERRKVMDFLCSEDFYFFYKKGKGCMIINMFYNSI